MATLLVPDRAPAGRYLLSAECGAVTTFVGDNFSTEWRVTDVGQRPVPKGAPAIDFDARWSPLNGGPGTTIRLSGVCGAAAPRPQEIFVYLVGVSESVSLKTSAGGSWKAEIPVPIDARPGPSTLAITCGEGDAPSASSHAVWRVLKPNDSTSADGAVPLSLAGVVVLVAAAVGWALVLRRRRAAA
ncbi:MAG: hypothetical protein AB7O61_12175 [Acidimicrobiia bacterium]